MASHRIAVLGCAFLAVLDVGFELQASSSSSPWSWLVFRGQVGGTSLTRFVDGPVIVGLVLQN